MSIYPFGQVIGLDTSMTSTGTAAIVTSDPWSGDGAVGGIRTKRHRSAKKSDGWDDLDRRITSITASVLDWAHVHRGGLPALVLIEEPTYGAPGASSHERSGLWWTLYRAFRERNCTVVGINSTHRKMYATGYGNGPNASKDSVLAAAIKRYQQIDIRGNDEADAVILMALGMRWLGAPIDGDLPKSHLRPFDKLGRPPNYGW